MTKLATDMATDTKQALLNSAERAVRARGFDGFSYADLAEDVGIRKASIHHHFPSKAVLSVALMARYHAEMDAICRHIDATFSSGGSRLAALINQYRSALNGGKSLCLCVSFSTSRESLSPEVIAQIGTFRLMLITWLTHVFDAGAADGTIRGVSVAGDEAAAALSVLEGAQLAARAEENPHLFENAIRLLQQRIL